MLFSKHFILGTIGAVIVTLLLLYGYYYQEILHGTLKNLLIKEQTHIVTLTQEGFVPKEISVAIGDTVTFKTNTGKAFWPASNIHPEHSLYPSFDPEQPVSPEDTWSFTFTEEGVYPYHDHIFANFTGYIYVGDTKQTIFPEDLGLDIAECGKVTNYNQKRACWDKQLERAMEVGGAKGAFLYFSKLYKTEPDVPKECHGWSHTLGKAGYAYYKEYKTIDLSSEASACGYGFYHAFLGELMKDTGDVEEARAFCERTTASLPDIETSCKHGIGHGASSIFSENPDYYGNLQKTANQAIAICEKVYTSDADLTECYDGVFNEIYSNVFNSRYGYSYADYRNAGEPFWQCQLQEKRYKESCYINVVGMFWEIFNRDVVVAMKYALSDLHDLEHTGPRIVAKISADRIQESIVAISHQDSIDACALVPDFLFNDCFGGILNGFVQHGEPNNLHEKGLAFCAELPEGHQKFATCVPELTAMISSSYTPTRMKQVCEEEPEMETTVTCTRLRATL